MDTFSCNDALSWVFCIPFMGQRLFHEPKWLLRNDILNLQRKIRNPIPGITGLLTIAHLTYLQKAIEGVVGETKDTDPIFIPIIRDMSIKQSGEPRSNRLYLPLCAF